MSRVKGQRVEENIIEPHWDASLYKKYSIKLQQTSALSLLNTLSCTGNETVLDIGCGDGKISVEIANKVPNGFVKAIDLSKSMIELANKEYSNIHNLSFYLMNAEKISFTDSFDIIVSFFCLQWVKDKLSTFKNIKRLLKPGGQLAAIITDRNPYLLEIRSKLIMQKKWIEYFSNYQDPTSTIDDDNYLDYLKIANFLNISYTQIPKSIFFDSYEELWSFIKMVTPAIQYLPTEEKKNQFIDELVQGYLETISSVSGSKHYITYTIKTLIAYSPIT